MEDGYGDRDVSEAEKQHRCPMAEVASCQANLLFCHTSFSFFFSEMKMDILNRCTKDHMVL